MERTVVVVGAGIAGLAVAYEIRERAAGIPGGIEVHCVEAAARPGGNIRTTREDGFVCEWGPNGFLDNAPATLDLARRLGIAHRLLPSNEASARRFLFRAGRLRQLPATARSFLTSDALSWPGKLRVLAEPFGRTPARDEDAGSVFDFAKRRIGPEGARVLVDAMVSGIYAGDPRRLCLRSTFPRLWAMESRHGSLTRAMLARRRQPAGPGGRLTSFRDGLQELTDALAGALGGALRLGTTVAKVSDAGVRGFRVHTEQGAPIDAGSVVLACPSWSAAEIVAAADGELAGALAGIPSAPVAVAHLGFDEPDLARPLDGFGFLVPREQGPRILGVLWTSSIFAGRAPAGKVLLTAMIGGANDPDAVELSDERLVEIVRGDLRTTMGLSASPRFVRIFRHARGIPQYTLGHPERLATIERRLAIHPGLAVCGNSYRGISVNACVEEAPRVAEAALASLAARNASTTATGSR